MSKSLTIDEALNFLQEAKTIIGGDAVLVLSLTGSSLQDVNVNNMNLVSAVDFPTSEDAYVEVQALHPDLQQENEGWHREKQRYSIVKGCNADDLEMEVNKRIRRGWKIVGSAIISPSNIHYQTMIRE